MSAGHTFTRRFVIGASLAGVVLVAAGCVYVPKPRGPVVEGGEVRQEELAFLKPSETTKEEVIGRFGNPTFLWRDENILVYRWVRKAGILLWAVGGHYSASFGAIDVPQEFAFLLKFDGGDRLVKFETVKRPMLKPYGEFLLEWRDAEPARESQTEGEEP